MVRLDSHLLPSFLAVAKALNFTEAARHLGSTQSGLSQHIAKLEESLGTELFIRANKKIHLTLSGVAFKRYAENYLESENHLFAQLHGEKGAITGEVRYAMPESCLMTPHLSQLLEKRTSDFPELKLNVTIAGHEEILQLVLNHEVDFGFCSEVRAIPGLKYTPYCVEEYVLVGTKNYLKKLSRMEDFARVPFIMHPGFSNVIEAWWKKQNPRHQFPNLNVVASLNHFQGIKALLLSGTGVSILPRQCVEIELTNKSLVELLPSSKKVNHQICIVTLENANLPRRVTRVIEEFHAMID